MKLGLSTYSLQPLLNAGELSVPDAVRWIAEQGGEHAEIVPIGFSLIDNPALAADIRRAAEEAGIELSNYAVGADFAKDEPDAFEEAVRLAMKHVDAAHALGVKLMRHDVVGWRPPGEGTLAQFEHDLPRLAEACRRVADYAAERGITTSVENHGFYVQASERVARLVRETGRSNFRTTLDVGNFLCVDEDPVSAVMNNLPIASIVHLKDFYIRPRDFIGGEGWFRTTHGRHLRGAIVGCGDIDMPGIFRILKQSGYDGYISIEFEGMEDCRTGSRIGLANARRLWDNA